MSSLGGSFARQVVPLVGDGSAQGAGSGSRVLQYLHATAMKDGEFLQLFNQVAVPVAGNIPVLSLEMPKDTATLWNFDPGVLFSLGFTWGVSTTFDLFTATATPSDYLISFGLLTSP